MRFWAHDGPIVSEASHLFLGRYARGQKSKISDKMNSRFPVDRTLSYRRSNPVASESAPWHRHPADGVGKERCRRPRSGDFPCRGRNGYQKVPEKVWFGQTPPLQPGPKGGERTEGLKKRFPNSDQPGEAGAQTHRDGRLAEMTSIPPPRTLTRKTNLPFHSVSGIKRDPPQP
jgi:hypothetical protein